MRPVLYEHCVVEGLLAQLVLAREALRPGVAQPEGLEGQGVAGADKLNAPAWKKISPIITLAMYVVQLYF